MELEAVRRKLAEIKRMGYVKTRRTGPTGIGYTLETLLGIDENNISSPDLGTMELKAHRYEQSSLLTLFTFNKNAWVIKQLEAIRMYGSPDENGRMGLYYTMRLKPNSAGLFLHVDEEFVAVRSIDGNIIARWELSEIASKFAEKAESVLLVSAFVEWIDGTEHFLYDRARLLSGGTSVSILRNQFEQERLLLDLRLHDAGTRARNHGTGFRVRLNHLDELYSRIEEIELL